MFAEFVIYLFMLGRKRLLLLLLKRNIIVTPQNQDAVQNELGMKLSFPHC